MAAVRVDKWLWCVRVFKTRTQAADACSTGRVRIGDEVVKPARRVAVDDVVEVRRRDRTIVYRVVDPIEKRVSAKLAAEAVEDLSPPPPPKPEGPLDFGPVGGAREQGMGRPTKRERREIDRLRGRRP